MAILDAFRKKTVKESNAVFGQQFRGAAGRQHLHTVAGEAARCSAKIPEWRSTPATSDLD